MNGETVVDEDPETLLTRRRLLAAGAVMAASVTLPASASAKPSAAAAKAKPLVRYTREGYRRARFSPHVGAPVELCLGSGAAVRATLLAIEDVAYVKSLKGHQDVYTLIFRGPAAPVLAAGVMGIRHKDFGVVELYVAPGAARAGAQDYVAVVNRHLPRSAARRAPRAARA